MRDAGNLNKHFGAPRQNVHLISFSDIEKRRAYEKKRGGNKSGKRTVGGDTKTRGATEAPNFRTQMINSGWTPVFTKVSVFVLYAVAWSTLSFTSSLNLNRQNFGVRRN